MEKAIPVVIRMLSVSPVEVMTKEASENAFPPIVPEPLPAWMNVIGVAKALEANARSIEQIDAMRMTYSTVRLLIRKQGLVKETGKRQAKMLAGI